MLSVEHADCNLGTESSELTEKPAPVMSSGGSGGVTWL